MRKPSNSGLGELELLPEQERALAWIRRRGTEAPLAEIRSRVSTYAEIGALRPPPW